MEDAGLKGPHNPKGRMGRKEAPTQPGSAHRQRQQNHEPEPCFRPLLTLSSNYELELRVPAAVARSEGTGRGMPTSICGRTEAFLSLKGLSWVVLMVSFPQSERLGLDAQSEGSGEEGSGVEWTRSSHSIPDTETKNRDIQSSALPSVLPEGGNLPTHPRQLL